MREHKGAIGWHETTLQVWGHAAESGHAFDFDNVRVIDRDRNKGGRLLREAWQHDPNRATDLLNSIHRTEPCDTDLPTEGDQPGAIQLKEEEDEEEDWTPQDPTTN